MGKVYSKEEIVGMYNEIESEEHYDSDDISTIICNRIIVRENMSGDEEYYRFIYDVFDVCRKHVDSTYNSTGVK